MKLKFISSLQRLRRPERLLRNSLLLLAAFVLTAGALAIWILWDLPDIMPLKNPSTTLSIEVPDWQGAMHTFKVGPKNPYWAPLDSIPDELKWAVIVAEDANFYEHGGIDVPALKEAIKYDLKRKRLAHGASTITQQLAKNLFLSRNKSIRRKLREVVIAQLLEGELTKGRILELYMNVVELGPLVYGVGQGSRYHFDKPVHLLTPAEAAFLAAMLPGPRIAFNPETKGAKVRQRAARLLRLLGLRRILSEIEIADALDQLEQLGGPRTTGDDSSLPGDQ
ncbi:MAG: transglycosylase domain-containing protein [Desulfuromonadales bacterium]